MFWLRFLFGTLLIVSGIRYANANQLCSLALSRMESAATSDQRITAVIETIAEIGSRPSVSTLKPPESFSEKKKERFVYYRDFLAPEGENYAFHSIFGVYWAIQEPNGETVWAALSENERRLLLQRLERAFQRGKYSAQMSTYSRNLSQMALRVKELELRDNFENLSVKEAIKRFLLFPFTSVPLIDLVDSALGDRNNVLDLTNLAVASKVFPTAFSPSRYFARAQSGCQIGICRDSAFPLAGVLLELGAPRDHIRLGAGFSPFILGHAWLTVKVSEKAWPITLDPTGGNTVDVFLQKGVKPFYRFLFLLGGYNSSLPNYPLMKFTGQINSHR